MQQSGSRCTKLRVNHPPVFDGLAVEVDEPVQGVLVHGVDVGQIGHAEEQHRGMLGNVSVTLPGRCNLDLCLLCDLGGSSMLDYKTHICHLYVNVE